MHHLINKAQRFIKVSGEIAELGKTAVLGSDEKGVAMTPLMNSSSHHADLETRGELSVLLTAYKDCTTS